jgi:hypothetical protein
MKTSQPIDGVLLLEYPTRRDLTLAMCRIEEFYESPHDHIRNNVFTMDQFITTYADVNGKINYFNEWSGFNVPKEYVDRFFKEFTIIRESEAIIKSHWARNEYRYLIAVQHGDDPATLAHELAHAKFNLDTDFRQNMVKFVVSIDQAILRVLKKDLIDENYADNTTLLIDEIQAYLLTSTIQELTTIFKSVDLMTLLKLQRKIKGIL